MLNTGRLLLGQYKPGTGLAHRLDPRTKIILVFMIMLVVLLHTDIRFYAGLTVILFAWLLIDGPGWRQVLANLKPIIWLMLFTALIHLIFSGKKDPHILYDFGFMTITKTAGMMAITFSMRIIIFVLSTFLVSLTTSPLAVSEAIVALLRPLRHFKIPIYDMGMILFIALRFIPVLTNEMEMIRKAQFVRGVDFSGSWINRIKTSASLVIPVFFAALRRADDLSIAIETRGYVSGRPRSSLKPLAFRPADFVILGAVPALFLIVLFGGRLW